MSSQHALPNSYIVLDIETTGLTPTSSEILQIGYLVCINGVVQGNSGYFLRHNELVLQAYENSTYVQRRLAEGRDDFVKAADVRTHGIEPVEAFKNIRALHDKTMSALPDSVVVGHNIGSFDMPFLEYHFSKAGYPITLNRDRIVDTGILFKAASLRESPYPGESCWEFQRRIADRRSTVKWNLAHAVTTLGLDALHGLHLEKAHDAVVDCLLTHYLYQNLRDSQARESAA